MASIREQVCIAILTHGPMSIKIARSFFPTLSRDSLSCAFKGCVESGYIRRDGLTYYLEPHVIQQLREKCANAIPNQKYTGEIVPARTGVPFRPLKSVPWSQHLNRLRDVSFIALSASKVA